LAVGEPSGIDEEEATGDITTVEEAPTRGVRVAGHREQPHLSKTMGRRCGGYGGNLGQDHSRLDRVLIPSMVLLITLTGANALAPDSFPGTKAAE
jgi:hypothetical protein